MRLVKVPRRPNFINQRRAYWAGLAMRAFQKICSTDPEDTLGDLLCNLRHWCDWAGVSFNQINKKSEWVYELEKKEDRDARA